MIISKNYPFCPRKNLAPISAAAGATSQPNQNFPKKAPLIFRSSVLSVKMTRDSNWIILLII